MTPYYFISVGQNNAEQQGTIHDPNSKLKVKVFDLERSDLEPREGEIQYFVTAGKEILTFETRGYNKHRTLLILHMIATYCMYLGLFEARIHATLPY